MKYIFNIIAIVLSVCIWIYVYSIKNKKSAMYKVVFVGADSTYLMAQMYLWFKVCKYIPEEKIEYAYKLQLWCLIAFLGFIIVYTLINAYINRIQKKEDASIAVFSLIRRELEECTILIHTPEVLEKVRVLCDSARCMDPVCYGVETEEQEILRLVKKLKQENNSEEALKLCAKIDELLRLRKIRAIKE